MDEILTEQDGRDRIDVNKVQEVTGVSNEDVKKVLAALCYNFLLPRYILDMDAADVLDIQQSFRDDDGEIPGPSKVLKS